jgi:hypothetical protein
MRMAIRSFISALLVAGCWVKKHTMLRDMVHPLASTLLPALKTTTTHSSRVIPVRIVESEVEVSPDAFVVIVEESY